LQPQEQVQRQERALLLEQEPPLLALQRVVAVHRLLAQVFQQSCSGSQLNFQTYTIDMRSLGQHRPFSQPLTVLLQPAPESVQVALQILRLQ
jgi:hypothetical protein